MMPMDVGMSASASSGSSMKGGSFGISGGGYNAGMSTTTALILLAGLAAVALVGLFLWRNR